MKCLRQICFAIALFAVLTSASAIAQTSVGVNYNGLFTSFNITDMQASKTTWIRGFFDITALLQRDGTCATSTVQSDPNLTEINAIHRYY